VTGSPSWLSALWEATHQQEVGAHSTDRVTGRSAPWPQWRARFTWIRDHDVPDGQQLWRSATTLTPALTVRLPGDVLIDGAPVDGTFCAPAGLDLCEDWSLEPYRMVWTSRDLLMILSYTEGDLSQLTCDDPGIWARVLREHAAFYRRH
jgi:hypothetical protein